MNKAWNFVPLHEIREAPSIKSKGYSIKKVVPFNNKSPFSVRVKNRIEFADYDYVHKLSLKDRQWLQKFHTEWLNASFTAPGKKLIRGAKNQQAVYNRNNARNRDLFAFARVHKILDYMDPNDDFNFEDYKKRFR